MSNLAHEEFQESLEWIGYEFDPDYFDKNEINELLQLPDYGCIWIE